MEFRELVAFVAVAEAGSVRAAAERLHLSQPALTRRIQRLEESLGVALVDHRRRPAALTAVGRAFLERSRRAVMVMEGLRGAQATAGSTEAEYRIGIVSSLAGVVLPGLLMTPVESSPRLRLRASVAWSQSLVDELQRGDLDAAIVYARDARSVPSDVVGDRLLCTRLSIVASHPRARTGHGHRRAPRTRLSARRWLVNGEGCCFRRALVTMLETRDMPIGAMLEVNGVERQLALAARGVGLAFVPEVVFRRSPVRRHLRRLDIPGSDARVAIWMMYRPAGPVLDATIRRLTSYVKRRLEATT